MHSSIQNTLKPTKRKFLNFLLIFLYLIYKICVNYGTFFQWYVVIQIKILAEAKDKTIKIKP